MQLLNEAYKNEVLEAYQKISDTFEDFTQLIRKRVPYEEWPDHCKIAGVSEDLMGSNKSLERLPVKIDSLSEKINEYQNNMWEVMKARGLDPVQNLLSQIISRLEDIGRAQVKLKMILDDKIFDTLSKHDPYWHSKYELESDKLDDLRGKFSCFQDNLWDLWAILRKEEEE